MPTYRHDVSSFKTRSVQNSYRCCSNGVIRISFGKVRIFRYFFHFISKWAFSHNHVVIPNVLRTVKVFYCLWSLKQIFVQRIQMLCIQLEWSYGQCGPEFSSIIPPSKPSSFSLLFFVSSSVIFRTYFFPFASVITEKSVFFSWRRFCRLRRQKYSITSKKILFWSVTGLFMSNIPHSYNFLRSSWHIGCLCSTLASPCRLSSTHFAPKTLLASLNAGSFMIFMSRVER